MTKAMANRRIESGVENLPIFPGIMVFTVEEL